MSVERGITKTPSNAAERALLSVVDCCLAGVFLVAPWFMGGRHPVGEFVVVSLALVMAVAWCALGWLGGERTRWVWTGAELLIAGGALLIGAQLIHLPPDLLATLSPHTAKVLPLWTTASESPIQLGVWSRISLAPAETAAGLMMFLSYGLIFLVAAQRIRETADVERLLGWLGLAAMLMAVVGLLQYLAGNGKYLWVYQHPFRDTSLAVKGPYINQNHFAHFLALSIGPLMWSAQRAMRRGTTQGRSSSNRQALGWSLALGVVLFAGLMTLSRAGAAAMLVATLVSLGVSYRVGMLSRRFAVGLVGAFVLIGAALAVHGLHRVSDRLDDYTSIDQLDQNGQRRDLWAADFKAVKDFPLTGVGVGAHRFVYPLYYNKPSDVEYTHAENGYLQVTMETGLAGLALLLAAIALAGYWCLSGLKSAKTSRDKLLLATVAAGLAASVVHSLADFVWYIPSLAAVTAIIAACALRLRQLSASPATVASPSSARRTAGRSAGTPRFAFAAALVVVAVAGAWMETNCFSAAMASPAWDDYLTRALSEDASVRAAALSDEQTFAELQDVLAWTPNQAVAHVRLAQVCLRRFEKLQVNATNAMPLNQIRDVAVASKFASRAELNAWMARAFGPHAKLLDRAAAHAKAGLALSPLLGEAYVYLTDLCFLDGSSDEGVDAYVAQSLLARPYQADVLLGAGAVAALRGDEQGVIKFWGPVLRRPSEVQDTLIAKLVEQHVPLDFITLGLKPNLIALRKLDNSYIAQHWTPEQRRPLFTYWAAVAEAEVKKFESPSADLLMELARLNHTLGQEKKALATARRALDDDPNSLEVHRALGEWLLEAEDFSAAEKHLSWCARRQSDDLTLRSLLETAAKGRVSMETTAGRATQYRRQ